MKEDFDEAAKARPKQINPKRLIYALNPGNAWNPLKKYPRNHPCFCGSELKHKKCCLPFVGEFTTKAAAAQVNEFWNDLLSGAKTINVRGEERLK